MKFRKILCVSSKILLIALLRVLFCCLLFVVATLDNRYMRIACAFFHFQVFVGIAWGLFDVVGPDVCCDSVKES